VRQGIGKLNAKATQAINQKRQQSHYTTSPGKKARVLNNWPQRDLDTA
jgi:hypothetical protein